MVCKVFGERNTGSTYFQKLLEENTTLEFLPGGASPRVPWHVRKYELVRDFMCFLQFPFDLGWKHAFPPSKLMVRLAVASPDVYFLIAKNPYAWLLSLYRKPYNRKQSPNDFSSFLRTPWKTLRRERARRLQIENPVSLWNQKYSAYLSFHKNHDFTSFLINYEDLLESPTCFVEEIARKIGTKLEGETIDNIEKSPKIKDVKKFSYYKDYYLNQKYLDEMDNEDVEFISSELDASLVADWGYDLL